MAGIIVHEWLESHGGSEQVVEQMALAFPDAPIQALWNDVPDRFEADRVYETWLAKSHMRSRKSVALPFMLPTWRNLRSTEAEWLLCSSHLFAHHAKFAGPARDAPKFVYAHTPARYIWTPELDTRGSSLLARTASIGLKKLDRARAQEAQAVAANSTYVKERIAHCWEREAEVIYPPVNVSAFATKDDESFSRSDSNIIASLPSEYILGASRFVAYKRLEDVISAGNVAGLPVVLAGSGPELEKLQSIATTSKVPVLFVNQPSSNLLIELFRRALAFVFPPIEDFGIMPVEAMAAGTPVIGNRRGGASETVLSGKTGFLVDNFCGQDVKNAIESVQALSSDNCVKRAWEFDESIFRKRIRSWITGNDVIDSSPIVTRVGA